jgi:hypothetical protein
MEELAKMAAHVSTKRVAVSLDSEVISAKRISMSVQSSRPV